MKKLMMLVCCVVVGVTNLGAMTTDKKTTTFTNDGERLARLYELGRVMADMAEGTAESYLQANPCTELDVHEAINKVFISVLGVITPSDERKEFALLSDQIQNKQIQQDIYLLVMQLGNSLSVKPGDYVLVTDAPVALRQAYEKMITMIAALLAVHFPKAI